MKYKLPHAKRYFAEKSKISPKLISAKDLQFHKICHFAKCTKRQIRISSSTIQNHVSSPSEAKGCHYWYMSHNKRMSFALVYGTMDHKTLGHGFASWLGLSLECLSRVLPSTTISKKRNHLCKKQTSEEDSRLKYPPLNLAYIS